MDLKTIFSRNTEEMKENKQEEEVIMNTPPKETQEMNTEIENIINQMADAIQKELYDNIISTVEKILSPCEEKYASLCKAIEYLYKGQQQLLIGQDNTGNKLKVLLEELVKVTEMQEETIQKQHNASLKFQEDVIYRIQKNLIMELIGIADNIRMIVESKENNNNFDLLGAVKDLGKWVDASLSNNSVRKFQDTDLDNTMFNRKRQELIDKEGTDDETKNGTYRTENPGYVWSVPYVVVNSEVQLKKILDENNSPQMFSYVIRPEEIVRLVYKKENKTEE